MFEPRNRQINICLNEEEHRMLIEAAAMKGLGRAAYLRMLLLKSKRREEVEEASKMAGN